MGMIKRLKLKIARFKTAPSPAKIMAELRRDAKRQLLANWFYQGESGHE